jgi:uncharacterized protein YkwD
MGRATGSASGATTRRAATASGASADAVGMWMGSPPHRAALLSKTWREIGVSALRVSSAPGIYEGDDVTLVTVDFGLRR